MVSTAQVLHQLPEKPMRLGDLVGLSYRIFRLNWAFLVAKLLFPSILTSVSLCVMQLASVHGIQIMTDTFSVPLLDLVSLIAATLMLIFAQWFYALRCTGIYRVIFHLSEDYKEGMQYANRRKWLLFSFYSLGSCVPVAVILIAVLLYILTAILSRLDAVGAVISVVSAFVIGLFAVVGLALGILFAALLSAIASAEPEPAGWLANRAIRLTSLYPLRGGSYVCLFMISLIMLHFALGIFLLPFEIYELYWVASSSTSVPYYLRVLEVIASTVSGIASTALVVIATGLYYRDVQFRAEGKDLLDVLDKLETLLKA